MMRKLGLSLLCITGLLTTNLFAATEQVFKTGPSVEYTLKTNEPQVISNQFLWSVSAVCKIKCTNKSSLISFKVLRKSGSFNGANLVVGDSMNVTVFDGDKMYITAVSGAKVELVNLSEETVYAECSVA